MGMASPSISVSMPAMILSKVDLPEPLTPRTPILAPGKKLKEMSLRICRLGGTILPTRFMEKTYWAMAVLLLKRREKINFHNSRLSQSFYSACLKSPLQGPGLYKIRSEALPGRLENCTRLS